MGRVLESWWHGSARVEDLAQARAGTEPAERPLSVGEPADTIEQGLGLGDTLGRETRTTLMGRWQHRAA